MSIHFVIERHAVVTSTMDVCRERAERGAATGLVIVADAQTAGRGRAGRAWFSPPGQSLYLSLLLRPHPSLIAPAVWMMAGAVAVASAIEQMMPAALPPRLKWPNDVLLEGRKVAGILLESAFHSAQMDYAILGIGVNVNTTFDDAPEDVRARATSLRLAHHRLFEREVVLARLLEQCAVWLSADRAPALLHAYRARLDTLGKPVTLQIGEALVRGFAEAVRDDGALIVRTAEGLRAVTAGEIVWARDATDVPLSM